MKLKIPILRHKKLGYNNVNVRISLPGKKTSQLAEFLGIMLGDGHVTKTQVAVTLGNKDEYAEYVADKMKGLFNAVPKIIITEHKYKIVYFGSTRAAKWLLRNGLAYNKKKAGVRLPCWIFKNKLFMAKALKGLIDTDGSIYKTRFGLQISFSNASLPLLADVRKVYKKLGFSPV